MIIALSGYAQSGKDACANFIREIDPDFEIKKFSHKLKVVASILTGIPVDKFEDQDFKKTTMGDEWTYVGIPLTVRDFLQRLGTDAVRNNLHHNAWVNALMSGYRKEKWSGWIDNIRFDYPASKWVITDCRFPNEAKAVKERGGIIVRVDRSGVNPVNAHPSETALDSWKFDHIIVNNGTLEDLKTSIQILLNETNSATSSLP